MEGIGFDPQLVVLKPKRAYGELAVGGAAECRMSKKLLGSPFGVKQVFFFWGGGVFFFFFFFQKHSVNN